MPTENNKDARGPSGLTESELLAWYESLISAGKARGIALDETHPMVADSIESKSPVVEEETADDALQDIVGKAHLAYALKTRNGFTHTCGVI